MKRIKDISLAILFLGTVGFIGVRNLPTARVTIEVVDEEDHPVPGANVGFSLYSEDPAQRELTDEEGRVTGEGRTRGYVGGGVLADGYYPTEFVIRLSSIIPPGVQVRRRYPDYIHRVMIRPIVNPVPMYAYRFYDSIPVEGEDVGFDLLKAGWVAPYGRGEVADVLVRIHTYDNDRDGKSGGEILWRFPNPGDGMVRIPPEDIHEQSWFRVPRTAPESGYIAEWREWSYTCPTEGRVNRVDPPGPLLYQGRYFIRIRTETNDEGQAIRAMYGRIVPRADASISWKVAFPQRRRSASIEFPYYINPDGTRNMEFDPERNLFRDILSIQERTRFPSEP